jgi:hypothetical protein
MMRRSLAAVLTAAARVVMGQQARDALLSDARAAGYRAGWSTATLRAESRRALGLPIIMTGDG